MFTIHKEVESILSVRKPLSANDIKRFVTPIMVIFVAFLSFGAVPAESQTLTKKNVKKEVTISFRQVFKHDKNLKPKETRIIRNGKTGLKKVIYQLTYKGSKVVSRKVLSQTILSKPVNRIVAVGLTPHTAVSRGGSLLDYSRKFTSRTTAYSPTGGATSAHTASGRRAVRDEDGISTVAVDPRVIPYGTKMYIESYGFAVAADCGSGIKGTTIDVFFNTRGEACNWGVRRVDVYILRD